MAGTTLTTLTQDYSDTRKYPATLALVAGIAAVILWSSVPVANKVALSYMDALSAALLRGMMAGLFGLLIAIIARLPLPAALPQWRLLLLSSVTSFIVWPLLLSLGLTHTSVSHTALIAALLPVFTVLLGALVEKRILKKGWWLGAGLALAATFILVSTQHTASSSHEGASLTGDLIVLAGVLSCATGYVSGGRLSSSIGPVSATFWGLAVSLVIILPAFAMLSLTTDWSAIAPAGWYAIGWMALLASTTGYLLWYFAIGFGNTSRIGSLLFAMPVIALIMAAFILEESITLKMIVVCFCIIAGAFIAQKHTKSESI